MVGLAEITGALTSLKTAFDIAKGLDGMRREGDIQAAVAEIQSVLMDAQSKAMEAHERHAALLESVRQLEAEIASMKNWEAEAQRYKLAKVGHNGVVAYSLKESVDPPEEPHHLCANCFQDQKKSILQEKTYSVGRAKTLVCNRCGAETYTSGVWYAEHGGGRGPGRAGAWGRDRR